MVSKQSEPSKTVEIVADLEALAVEMQQTNLNRYPLKTINLDRWKASLRKSIEALRAEIE